MSLFTVRPDYAERVEHAAAAMREKGFVGAPVAVVLGSGLGNVVDGMKVLAAADFSDVPTLATTTVRAHHGRLLEAEVQGTRALVLQGRLHAYEGLPMEDIVFPVALLAALGAKTLLLTNAAGGLHPDMRAGDLMAISDLIDLHLVDAARGLLIPDPSVPSALLARAATAGRLFDRQLVHRLTETGAGCGVPVRTGTYASLWGPNYEPPKEIGQLRLLGADAVGMSTGPEAIFAKALGLRIAGLSCITNVAVEFGGGEVTHDEVVEVGAARRGAIAEVVLAILPRLADHEAAR